MSMLEQSATLGQQQEMQRIDALNPFTSVWVSASAGSGKTTLLTQRVLRLLLQGLMNKNKKLPNILCLTYTKAAAAEMQNRIHKQLAHWAVLPEKDLQDNLSQTFNLNADRDVLKHARRLFAMVLEKPDAVRIMTMHAFCQMLLHRFPLEAGLAPHFTLLEGEARDVFESRVLNSFLSKVKADVDLTQCLQVLGVSQSSARTRAMLQQVFYSAGAWIKSFTGFPDIISFSERLEKELALETTETPDMYLMRHCAAPYVDDEQLMQAVQFLNVGSDKDKQRALAIADWINDKENRVGYFKKYKDIYLTGDGDIRKAFFTKPVVTRYPEIADIMSGEAARIDRLSRHYDALCFYHQQCAFYRLSLVLWGLYDTEKQKQAALTYDDLILKTRDVLSKDGVAQWILFKLDGGLDHVLIDEAQDTSPEQWDIIFNLLEEFLSGEGARAHVNRTLFVVGDEKQSIYSFQGADHHYYLSVKEKLFEHMRNAGKTIVELERVQSFRSTSRILSFVDEVFREDSIKKGVTSTPMRHFAARAASQGLVEMWPVLLNDAQDSPAPWHPPLQREDKPSASVQLAQRIAQTIKTWLVQGWHIKTREDGREVSRPIMAEDIVILLQTRSKLLSPVVRALKEQNVPVAGIDRMVLNEQGAVQDVLALCRFLLLPHDDLTLAEVLRGPFIRFTDKQLFELAFDRKGTLWKKLYETEKHAGVYAYLTRLLNQSDAISTFALLSAILFEACPASTQSGQAALVQCLGADAIDPLEQLLSAAQRYELQYSQSLQMFVQSVGRDTSQIKREQSKGSGEVRIMTTHGAKGLEAPIVFVPDLMRDPHKKGKQDVVFWHNAILPLAAVANAKNIPLVQTIKDEAKEADAQENRRLLYVALTRAADVLILCGAMENDKKKNMPWQDHCLAAMQRLNARVCANDVMQYGDEAVLSRPQAAVDTCVEMKQKLPGWITAPLDKSIEKQRIYNPSAFFENNEKVDAPNYLNPSSYERGRMLHRLLQLLPDVPVEMRETAALRFLKQVAPESDYAQDVSEVMAVLNHPVFAPIFSKDAQAEVPIVGVVEGKKISGQIDRLVITAHDVLVVDFKTNRPPPETADGVAGAYLAQMACYVTLLEKAFPEKTIHAGLLWTHSLKLMQLNNAVLAKGKEILKTAYGRA